MASPGLGLILSPSPASPPPPSVPAPTAVLLVGGSGYLGQHLITRLLPLVQAKQVRLGYTYNGAALSFPPDVEPLVSWSHALRLHHHPGGGSGDDVEAMLSSFQPDVLVLLAAMSSPAACEKDPEAAMAINAPAPLLRALQRVAPACLVVFISTDQVYCGDVCRPYVEDQDPAVPVNAYGRSKLACEALLSVSSPSSSPGGGGDDDGRVLLNFVVLRSSNIIGGPSPYRPMPKFLQWLDEKLQKASSASADGGDNDVVVVSLFQDEVRSFVHVQDITSAITSIIQRWSAEQQQQQEEAGDRHSSSRTRRWGHTFNMGGPEALSRVDLGFKVCNVRGYPQECVGRCRRQGMDGAMGFTSPLDISMDSSRLVSWLGKGGYPCTSMDDALPLIFTKGEKQEAEGRSGSGPPPAAAAAHFSNDR